MAQTKIQGNERNSQPVWDTIVRATNGIGEDGGAMRVLLHEFFTSGAKFSFLDHLRSLRNLWRCFLARAGKELPKAPRNRPLFVFLCGSHSTRDKVMPVFEAAQKRGLNPGILMGNDFILECLDFDKSTGLVRVPDIMSCAGWHERLNAFRISGKTFERLLVAFKRLDPSMAKSVRRIRGQIITEMTLFNIALKGLQRLYEEWEPSCLISGGDFWPFEHAVFTQARRADIPSFLIQHGVIGRHWWPFVADKLVLWGKPFYKKMRDLGAPAERLIICGMPAADILFPADQEKAAPNRQGQASNFVILSDTHARVAYGEVYSKFKHLLKSSLTAMPSVRWFVKLHPAEDESFYADMLDGSFPNFSILPKKTTLEEAIGLADVACTLWSTAGLEAMMMKKPLVVFDVAPLVREYAWWPESGGGTYIRSAESMVDFVKQASSDKRFLAQLIETQNKFLEENFANQGGASDAVLDLIEQCLREGRNFQINPGPASS